MNPLMHILGACSVSENKLTIVMWLCCSRKDKGQAVGDLSPLELLWAVSHSNGMGLAEKHPQDTADHISPNKRCGNITS